jgi:hypothetical protein
MAVWNLKFWLRRMEVAIEQPLKKWIILRDSKRIYLHVPYYLHLKMVTELKFFNWDENYPRHYLLQIEKVIRSLRLTWSSWVGTCVMAVNLKQLLPRQALGFACKCESHQSFGYDISKEVLGRVDLKKQLWVLDVNVWYFSAGGGSEWLKNVTNIHPTHPSDVVSIEIDDWCRA